MFGGKSSALWKRYRQYMTQRMNGSILQIAVIKHSLDTRYDDDQHITTHDGKKIPCIHLSSLESIDPREWDVIMIDEGQWFNDLYSWIEKYFSLCHTRIHIAGLNGDKNQKNFGDINLLSPFCSEEHIHYGMCVICGDSAAFTRYKGDSNERDIIGDDYYTVCHRHLNVNITE